MKSQPRQRVFSVRLLLRAVFVIAGWLLFCGTFAAPVATAAQGGAPGETPLEQDDRTLFLPLIVHSAGETQASTPAAPRQAGAVTPKVLFHHFDATSNLLARTDETGNVVWRADVRPFGQGTPTSPEYPLRFDGQPQEADLGGTYHLGARLYDPVSGRFLGADPLALASIIRAEPQRFNQYSYALNNPYTYRDPTGLEPYQHKFTRPWHAALWALRDIYQTAKDTGVEYGGIVYRNEDGTYSYSAPRTDHIPDTVNPWPEGGVPGKAIAFYHTHPKGENFSDSDRFYAEQQRIDAYVATPSGDLVRYDHLLGADSREKGIVQDLLDIQSPLLLWLFQWWVLPDLSGELD